MMFLNLGRVAVATFERESGLKATLSKARLAHPSIRAHTVSSTSFDALVSIFGSRTNEIAVARSRTISLVIAGADRTSN